MHNLTNEQIEAMFKERIEKNKKEINEILANAKTSDEKAEYQKLIDEVLSENTPEARRFAINKHDKICAALDEFNQLLGDYEADIKKAMQESGQ
jgi:5'-deoxynucleotidase YfbR-like HD superfamily hydrolase